MPKSFRNKFISLKKKFMDCTFVSLSKDGRKHDFMAN